MPLRRSLTIIALIISTQACALLGLGSAPPPQVPEPIQTKLRKDIVGQSYHLAATMFTGPMPGSPNNTIAEPRPPEALTLRNTQQQELPLPTLTKPFVYAGAEVKIRDIRFPNFARPEGPDPTPSAHIWIMFETTQAPAKAYVLLLPEGIQEREEFEQVFRRFFASRQWVQSWLNMRKPAILEGIYAKKLSKGMTASEMQATLGPPKIIQEDSAGIQSTADYGDLVVTLDGGTISEYVSRRAIAEEKRRIAEQERLKQEAIAEQQRLAQVEQDRIAQEAKRVQEAKDAQAKKVREAKEAKALALKQAADEKRRRLDEANRQKELAKVSQEQQKLRELDRQRQMAEQKSLARNKEATRQRDLDHATAQEKQAAAQLRRANRANEAEIKTLRKNIKAMQRKIKATETKFGKPFHALEAKLVRFTKQMKKNLTKSQQKIAKALASYQKSQLPLPLKAGSRGRDLGLTFSALGSDEVDNNALPNSLGAKITLAEPRKDGARSGLSGGDILRSFDGTDIKNPAHLQKLIRNVPSNKKIYIELVRQGEHKVLPIGPALGKVDNTKLTRSKTKLDKAEKDFKNLQQKLNGALVKHQRAARKANIALEEKTRSLKSQLHNEHTQLAALEGRPLPAASPTSTVPSSRKLGLRLGSLSEALKSKLSIKRGVLVLKVQPDSSAGLAGVLAQDIIISFAGQEVGSPKELARYAKTFPQDQKLYIELLRGSAHHVVMMPPAGSSQHARTHTEKDTLSDDPLLDRTTKKTSNQHLMPLKVPTRVSP
jgi:hypothetical protein